MNEDKKPFSVTISRPSCGNGDEYISIEVIDNKSRARFLELKVDYADFAQLVTGLSFVGCDGAVRNLERVGKKKVGKQIEFEVSNYYGSKDEAREKVNNYLVDGYVVHNDFTSQDSFFSRDGKDYARTTIFKWVDIQ